MGGTGTHTAILLNDVFAKAQVIPVPGNYEAKAENGLASATPGSTSFTLAP
jgi:hypothetical protein